MTRAHKAMTAVLLSALLALGMVPSAQAYPAGYSIGLTAASTYQIQMKQGYADQMVTVGQNHWNYEYGNTAVAQSVNSFLLRPRSCVSIWKRNDANSAWIYTGVLVNPATEGWVPIYVYRSQYLGKFKSNGKNLIQSRPFSSNTTCF